MVTGSQVDTPKRGKVIFFVFEHSHGSRRDIWQTLIPSHGVERAECIYNVGFIFSPYSLVLVLQHNPTVEKN